MKALAYLLVFLNVLDVYTTSLGFEKLCKDGYAQERNLLMRWAFTTLGYLPAIGLKLALILGVAWFAIRYRNDPACRTLLWYGLIVLNAFYGYVVCQNWYKTVIRDGYSWWNPLHRLMERRSTDAPCL